MPTQPKNHTLAFIFTIVFALILVFSLFLIYSSVIKQRSEMINTKIQEKAYLVEALDKTLFSEAWHQQEMFYPQITWVFVSEIAKSQDIAFVRIINSKGEIEISSKKEEWGKKIAEADLTALYPDRSYNVIEEIYENENIFTILHPVDDKVLALGFSTAAIEKSLSDIWKYSIFLTFLAIIFLAALLLFLFRAVISPIKKLRLACEDIKGGDLETNVEIKSRTEIGGLIDTFNEMTDELAAARRREKLVEEMKTEFVSLTAHQLRTPLSAIKWTLRMILDGDLGKLNKSQKDFLERTYSSNERMIHLINDLLNVTRIEEGRFLYKPSPAQLENIVWSVVNAVAEKIKLKQIDLEYKAPAKKLPTVKIDAEKIEIALSNLIDNALSYTPAKGKITVSLIQEDNHILVSVNDNGVGIPVNQQPRIFTKFFRGENVIKIETEGTGLGLYITKNIIEAHGGKIWFSSRDGSAPNKNSEKGKGTTFYFTIPINNN